MKRACVGRLGQAVASAAILLTILLTVPTRVAHAIVGGVLDGDGHPNVGTFVVTRSNDVTLEAPSTRGSGTLIHPRVALTAGHVTIRMELRISEGLWNREDLKFSFDENALDGGSWRDISAMITHPDYLALVNPQTGVPPMDYGAGAVPYPDIGLVILDEPVDGVTAASLPPEALLDSLNSLGALGNVPDGTKLSVVGYGVHGAAPNQILPKDGLRRIAQSEFKSLKPRWLYLDQLAAHGNGGSASGDSGGPTFWIDPLTGDETLVSLTSRGDDAFVGTGITYRVDTPEALEFIGSVIEMVEAGAFDTAASVHSASAGAVPEPPPFLLAGIGAMGIAVRFKRRSAERLS